ncbi:hypothetical protein Bbelb_276700 [Branchiostoma belcheri]|nr:hypothetical protein Bbelb_276700 [Branchiostoma belcheri]
MICLSGGNQSRNSEFSRDSANALQSSRRRSARELSPEAAQYDHPPPRYFSQSLNPAVRNVNHENPTTPRVTEHWNDPVRNPLLCYFDTCYPVVNGLRALGSECRVEFSTGQRVPSQDSALEFLFPSAQGPDCRRYSPREFRTGRPGKRSE